MLMTTPGCDIIRWNSTARRYRSWLPAFACCSLFAVAASAAVAACVRHDSPDRSHRSDGCARPRGAAAAAPTLGSALTRRQALSRAMPATLNAPRSMRGHAFTGPPANLPNCPWHTYIATSSVLHHQSQHQLQSIMAVASTSLGIGAYEVGPKTSVVRLRLRGSGWLRCCSPY